MLTSRPTPRIHTWALLALAVATVAGFGAGGCAGGGAPSAAGQSGTEQRRSAPVPVVVTSVARQDVAVQLRAIGTVEPVSTVTLRSQVEGTVAQVHFQEGQTVSRDALLFTIDPRPFEAALRQAQAQLARNRAERDNAQVELKRRTTLVDQGFVSRDEYDQAVTRAASLRAAVQGDEAAVENARLDLQYCSIRSPIDGRIGRILAHAGNVVKRNETPLAIVNQIRPVDVAFAVPERELPRIRHRAATGPVTVQALVSGDARVPVPGTLSFFDNAVDTQTGTVLLKARFPNDDEALWPGQFIDIAVTLETLTAALVVPTEAVQTGQLGPYVYVVTADRTAEVRPVTTGYTTGPIVVIERGLAVGDAVVTDGQIRLAAGSKVEVGGGAAQATPTPTAHAQNVEVRVP
jgi:multidrug efflux system membrane fusion protein